jgi:hypothetical protein
MKDKIAMVLSVIALSVSLYQFAIKEVGLNAITTDVGFDANSGEHEFEIAFQSYGNVDVVVTEVEIRSVESPREGSDACTSNDTVVSTAVEKPADGDWFAVEQGGISVKKFTFEDGFNRDARRHYCVRYEVHDVYGHKYETDHHVITVSVLNGNPLSRLDEKVVNLAQSFYWFRP